MATAAEGERRRLFERVRAMLDAGVGGDPAPFEPLALDMFAFQYAHNEPYRRFCDAKRATPDRVSGWREIPAFPTHAFKTDVVASFPMEQAVHEILTSGTTEATASPTGRGKIFRDELGRELVFHANRLVTGAALFPDFEQGRRCRLLILTPSPQLAPSMGMAIGMEQTRVHFGTEDSTFLIGRTGLDVRGLVRALREAEGSGVPVALIGATSAFVFFFNACRGRQLRFRLPPGSRIADGGGYRGRFGEMTRDDYYALAGEVFGVPESHCVNILGMGESGTNYADDVLAEHVAGRTPPLRHKVPPPWTRVEAASLEARRGRAAASPRRREPADGRRGPERQPGLHRRRGRVRDHRARAGRGRQGRAAPERAQRRPDGRPEDLPVPRGLRELLDRLQDGAVRARRRRALSARPRPVSARRR
jgi:hypothetical protein